MKFSVPYDVWILEVDTVLTLAEEGTVVGAHGILAHSPLAAPLRSPSAEDETRVANAMRSLSAKA
jgi:hypothetical protein